MFQQVASRSSSEENDTIKQSFESNLNSKYSKPCPANKHSSSVAILHTYVIPVPRYTEIKVGGHVHDHANYNNSRSSNYLYKEPMKNNSSSCRGFRTRRQAAWAYRNINTSLSSYAATKCGGHALDHLRFIGIGKPSRPIINTSLRRKYHNHGLCPACVRKLKQNSSIYCPKCNKIQSFRRHDTITRMLLPMLSLLRRSFNERTNFNLKASRCESKLQSYKFVKTLGKSLYSNVYLVKKNGNLVVLKESDKFDYALTEIRALMKIKCHDHVMKLSDAFFSNNLVYIEMEYCSLGDLSNLLKSSKELTFKTVLSIWTQLVTGLSEIHRAGIIHCDLNPSNVLISDGNVVKISDFGVSKILNTRDDEEVVALGTLGFIAPELKDTNAAVVSRKTDVWSLGAIVLAMLWKDMDPSIDEMPYEKIVRDIRSSGLHPDVTYILCQMLQPNPVFRATLGQVEAVLQTLKQEEGAVVLRSRL